MAVAATADGEGTPFERLIALAIELFDAGPRECVRLQRLAVWLAANDVPLTDSRAAAYLAPILCSDPDEQALFKERFKTLIMPPAEEGGEEDGSAPVEQVAARRSQQARKGWGLASFPAPTLAALCIAAAVAAALLIMVAWGGMPKAGIVEATTNFVAETSRAGDDPRDQGGPLYLVGLLLAAVGIPAALGLPFLAWRRGRRAWLRRIAGPETGKGDEAVKVQLGPLLFGDPRIRRGLTAFRRHQNVQGYRLDVRSSLKSTVRAGGFPVLRFGTRARTPEYVVLVERASPLDHLPLVGELLVRHLQDEKIAAALYEFSGDLSFVRRLMPTSDEARRPLGDMIALHHHSRLLVVAQPGDLLLPNGDLPVWVDEVRRAFDRPVLLNPREGEAADFTARERFEAKGVMSFPLGAAGLLAYAELLRTGSHGSSGSGSPRPFGGQRGSMDRLTSDENRPSNFLSAQILHDLRRSLGESGFRLLQAAAVFPVLAPSLSLFLAYRLAGDDAEEAEQSFLAVASLRVMRLGRIPDWLRTLLARSLEASDLRTIIEAVTAYLSASGEATDLALTEQERERVRRRLTEWLEANRGSELADPLFIDALRGRSPTQLGRTSLDRLERVREAVRRYRVPDGAFAGAGLVAAFILVPLLVQANTALGPNMIAPEPVLTTRLLPANPDVRPDPPLDVQSDPMPDLPQEDPDEDGNGSTATPGEGLENLTSPSSIDVPRKELPADEPGDAMNVTDDGPGQTTVPRINLGADYAGSPSCRRTVASLLVSRSDEPPQRPPIDPIKNLVWATQNGILLWNGAEIDLKTLRQYLDVTQTMEPTPELHLRVDTTATCKLATDMATAALEAKACTGGVCRLQWNQIEATAN